MSTEILTLILSTVQTVVLIVSAFLLIRQLKQFEQSLYHDAYSKIVEYYISTTENLIGRLNISNFFYQTNADFGRLSDDQKEFYNYLCLVLGYYERLFQLYKIKWVDEKTWESWERWLAQVILPTDLFEIVWKNERIFFHEDFYKYVDILYEDYNKHKQLVTK